MTFPSPSVPTPPCGFWVFPLSPVCLNEGHGGVCSGGTTRCHHGAGLGHASVQGLLGSAVPGWGQLPDAPWLAATSLPRSGPSCCVTREGPLPCHQLLETSAGTWSSLLLRGWVSLLPRVLHACACTHTECADEIVGNTLDLGEYFCTVYLWLFWV